MWRGSAARSCPRRRARAARYPYVEDERWPCGEFVVQAEDDAGLPAWTAANRGIEDTDIVLWHVFGLFHTTRPEDWPVMPVDTASFWLKPVGFFDRNPALNVPPTAVCHTGPVTKKA